MLTNASKLLLRNEALFEQGKWLLVNPLDAEIFAQLSNPQIFGFHQYFDIYQQAVAASDGDRHLFGAAYPTDEKFDGIVIYMPKAKPQAVMLLANLSACLKPGGQLLLVGENKGGINSADKLLGKYSEQVNKMDSARHCSLYWTSIAEPANSFDLEQWFSQTQINVGGLSYTISSLPGVFGHNELDPGTRLLLENIKQVPAGKVLDFACGTGVIGCYLGLKRPNSTITMCDVSALAVACAERSASLNKIKAKVIASNGLSELSSSFAAVYTNPPFHTGVQTDYSITDNFIANVRSHLQGDGLLLLVANHFLKYAAMIEKNLGSVSCIASTTKFKLYQAHKGKLQDPSNK